MLPYIELIRKKRAQKNQVPIYIAKIVIGDFSETIHIPLNYWSLDEYKKQWEEGLERIKTHNTSCLIAEIQDPKIDPFLNWWALYKVGDTIYIHNHMFVDFTYREQFGDTTITRETCYDFIPPRITEFEDGGKPSEWCVPIEDYKSN